MINNLYKSLCVISFSIILVNNIFANDKIEYKKAVFAGGCFWCLESDFDYMQKNIKLSHGGIISVVSGYDGGYTPNPTYNKVASGVTNYKESVEVTYNPEKIKYRELVEYFYRRIDPTDDRGQFCDKGKQYQSAIYYKNQYQKNIANNVTQKLTQEFKAHGKNVYTQILPSTEFYAAEKYHQKYHDKNPKRYCYYRTGCKRDITINRVWNGIDWKYNNIVPFDIPTSYAACLSR